MALGNTDGALDTNFGVPKQKSLDVWRWAPPYHGWAPLCCQIGAKRQFLALALGAT